MGRTINFEYDVKCRKCGNITRMCFGTNETTTKENFKVWVYEHGNSPIHKQCKCDNGMMLLHDLIGYGNILNIL